MRIVRVAVLRRATVGSVTVATEVGQGFSPADAMRIVRVTVLRRATVGSVTVVTGSGAGRQPCRHVISERTVCSPWSGWFGPPLAESLGERVDRLAQAQDVAAHRDERKPDREPPLGVFFHGRQNPNRLADGPRTAACVLDDTPRFRVPGLTQKPET